MVPNLRLFLSLHFRLVIAGNNMLQAVEPLSPGAFHYDREYGLTYEQVWLWF